MDIGAHFGYFSLFAGLNLGPAAKIIAIEPSSENFSVLKQNIKRAGIRNINVLNCAISNVSGKIKLFTSGSVNNSIYQDVAKATPNTYEMIESKRLEDILSENAIGTVDFLKIDCEGAEYDIFYNTPRHVLDRVTTISMEFHDLKRPESTANELAVFFKNNGFDVVKLQYSGTGIGLNYGKLIVTKLLLHSSLA